MSLITLLQWTLVCTLLCHVTPLFAVGKANFTREIEARLANPRTVRLGSHLFTVSKTKKTLSINSTDPGQKACQLSVNPFDENIQGRIHATAIQVSQKILVWGVHSSEIDGSKRTNYYTLLFVDPFACSYLTLRLSADEMPDSWPVLAPTIIVHDGGYDPYFDVYFPTQQICHPCQYNARNAGGKWVYAVLNPEAATPLSEFWMQQYPTGDYNYYFYAYNFQNRTAVIKLITTGLNEFKKVYVNHTIDAVSINYGNYQNTAVCYATPNNPGPTDRQNVTCERLNERLRPALSWQLPTSSDRLVSRIVIEVDGKGNTLIGVLYIRELRFYAYNVDGDLVDDLNFGQVNEELAYKELHGIRIDNEYCLVTVEQANVEAVEARHVIKCIDVSKYLNEQLKN